jgi:hypothetical protein
MQINFIDFKNLLKNYDVQLFDSQFRIAHFRFNNFMSNYQNGGGATNTQSFFNKLCSRNNCLVSRFIDSLIYNDKSSINYILSII